MVPAGGGGGAGGGEGQGELGRAAEGAGDRGQRVPRGPHDAAAAGQEGGGRDARVTGHKILGRRTPPPKKGEELRQVRPLQKRPLRVLEPGQEQGPVDLI